MLKFVKNNGPFVGMAVLSLALIVAQGYALAAPDDKLETREAFLSGFAAGSACMGHAMISTDTKFMERCLPAQIKRFVEDES